MIQSVMPNVYTADIEEALAFYRDQLGGTETFRTPRTGQPDHVELRMGDAVIAISKREKVREEGLPDPTKGHPMEFVLWCDSTDDTVARLRQAGTPVLREPNSGHVSGLRRAYVADPDGNWIALVSEETRHEDPQ
jgi:lactoylglutathione lyase